MKILCMLFLSCGLMLSAHASDDELAQQNYSAQISAISNIIQSRESLRHRFAKHLAALTEQIKNDPHHCNHRLEHTIRRYQALANAVTYAKAGDEDRAGSNLNVLLLLLEEREIIVKKIESLFRPCAVSRFVLQNIERYIGRAPSPQEREVL